MILTLDLQPQNLYSAVHELVRMVFPEHEIKMGEQPGADAMVALHCEQEGQRLVFFGEIHAGGIITNDQKSYELYLGDDEYEKKRSRLAKVFVYGLLCRYCGENVNPYGILTGVRPVKIVHRQLDAGHTAEQIVADLQSEYYMEEAKARNLMEIAFNNRPYLHAGDEAKRTISVYIGIPYCPSRCYYCSFPGAILMPQDPGLGEFLQALGREMKGIGDCINDLGLIVENIYIGGGTPSVLSEAELKEIFKLLNQEFVSSATEEITIEAGRPDTLTPAKLALFKKAGVNRICINPQTMRNETLKLIGRSHEAADINRAVHWAREAGIENINMDLIVGLPGEGLQENIRSCEEILAMRPENISVHSLAVKKGSRLAEAEGKSGVTRRVEEVKAGIDYFRKELMASSYLPYYMYRQKYMKASLENTAYSLPGHFCRYNIQVMEERQTILGLGGAAGSKFVNPDDWTLTNLHNPKDPASYCRRVEELMASKIDKLRALN